jgi:hypothetical protein
MAQYTVIWRDNGDDFMVTTVELGDVIDARQMSTNEWADLAYAAECAANNIDPSENDEYLPSNDGYDLITVIVGVPEYIY